MNINKIRVLELNENKYFVGKDVAKVLGYKKPNIAINKHCKKTLKSEGFKISGQQVELIPDSDVYRLMFHSKLPNSEKFLSWVLEEILPSSSNSMSDFKFSDANLIIRLLNDISQQSNELNILQKTSEESNIKLNNDERNNYVDIRLESTEFMPTIQIEREYSLGGLKLNEIFEILNEKYDLTDLLCGALDINEILCDEDVVNFLIDNNKYNLIDIEEYILKNIN